MPNDNDTDDSRTRRDWLRTLSTTGAVAGGGILGLGTSSASAAAWPGDRGPGGVEPELIGLEAVCLDADRDTALFRAINDGDGPALLEWTASPVEDGIAYLDCQRVRVVGDFAEVMIQAVFDTESGVGDMYWDFGAVDGSAVFDVADVDDIPEDAIVGSVDAFRDGTPVVPGGGDISKTNPTYEACQEEFFGEIIDDGAARSGSDTSASGGLESEGDGATGPNTLAVPPNGTRCFTVAATDGLATVDLCDDGEVLATASSGAAEPCSGPIRWNCYR